MGTRTHSRHNYARIKQKKCDEGCRNFGRQIPSQSDLQRLAYINSATPSTAKIEILFSSAKRFHKKTTERRWWRSVGIYVCLVDYLVW